MSMQSLKKFRLILLTGLAAWGMVCLAADRCRADAPASAQYVPPQYRNVGVDEYPNAQLPLDTPFYDEKGQTVPLGTFFQPNRPVILQLGYFDCPKLCDWISRGCCDSLRDMDLKGGKEFTYLFVSINPVESPNLAAVKRESFLAEYGKPGEGDGFHCLVGDSGSIKTLAQAVGFRYNVLGNTGQFAHPAVLFILTPDGKISRYLYGVSFPPKTMRLSLVEASKGKVGDSWDKLALMICCYDVATGQYAVTAMAMMNIAGVLTVFVIGGWLSWLFMHDPHRHHGPPKQE
jgi:protein SCO1/2